MSLYYIVTYYFMCDKNFSVSCFTSSAPDIAPEAAIP